MRSNTPFSGWFVLSGCFIVMFFVQGSIQTFAVFLPSIMRDTGFSLSSIAMISTLATIAAFGANMLIGPLVKKIGAKWILFIGTLICAAHFVMLSYSYSLTALYISGFCGGIAIGFGTVAPVSVIITNWFIAKRATYMSVVIAGSMFGGALLMPAAGQLIQHFDWRVTYRIIALLVSVIGGLAILFTITDCPHQKGQKAYGTDTAVNIGAHNQQSESTKSFSAAEARSSLSFWLLLVGVLLIGCSTNIENFLPAFWQSQGISISTSSNIMGVYAFITGICTIFLGRVTDWLGGKSYALLTSALFIIGTISIYFVGAAAMPLMILALIPFAAGAKKTSTLTPPLVVAETFGRTHYGAIIGNFTAMLQLGIAISNPLIGALHRTSGGYQVPFLAMACLNGIALLLIFMALKFVAYKPARHAAPFVALAPRT